MKIGSHPQHEKYSTPLWMNMHHPYLQGAMKTRSAIAEADLPCKCICTASQGTQNCLHSETARMGRRKQRRTTPIANNHSAFAWGHNGSRHCMLAAGAIDLINSKKSMQCWRRWIHQKPDMNMDVTLDIHCISIGAQG